MQRIDRIFHYVKENDNVTTQNIAEALNLQRSNVSKDLNTLVKSGRLKKSTTRPVNYSINPDFKPNENAINPVPIQVVEKNIDVFSKIIGATGSMRNAVDQAKAAILYPPKGLNCLITGPTGSGKTYFAHAMFQFAQNQNVIASNRKLIVFNCADYANNSELLMSHLFGYVKGAFTGADIDKEGLIQKADGSMLFLDEIHRLPPEGQEMIFYFMDHGCYSRLGETEKNHTADVRIVGATTEDLHSYLLDTFIRRIPINIQMPPFNSRPANEQIELVRVLIAIEADRINRKITLTKDVVKALIGSVSYGNIGQLKSNIQLICARSFMNQMAKDEINITLNDLTDNIKMVLVQLSEKRDELTNISNYLEQLMTVYPNQINTIVQSDTYELPYNLYDIIGDKAALLKMEGLDQEAINHFISTDINIHLKSFYKNHGFTFDAENRLSEVVDGRIIELTIQILDLVSNELNNSYQQNFIYAMSLHLASLLRKIQTGESRKTNDNIKDMAKNYPKEFQIAQKIRQLVSKEFQIEIANSEDYYLTVLLVSLKEEAMTGKIGIVVAAHGNSTASSMAQVVKELLDVSHIIAVDMPLDMHPKIAYEKIAEAIIKTNEGSGVLLMVDMGSLATFNNKLQKQTGVKVKTLDMVTTSLLLEAVRKSSVLGSDLNELYNTLQEFKGYTNKVTKEEAIEKKAIIAICSSGEGTAKRLQEIIEHSLKRKKADNINVISLSVMDVDRKITQIKEEFDILATTGIINPKIGVPFIPIEKLINQETDDILQQLLSENKLEETKKIELNPQTAIQHCIKFIEESYTFVNSKKIIEPLWELSEKVIENDEQPQTLAIMMNFIMHMAGVLERCALQKPLIIDDETQIIYSNISDISFLNEALDELEEQFQLQVCDAERYYIYQILKTHQ